MTGFMCMWTPAMIERLRHKAAAGKYMSEAAAELGVLPNVIRYYADKHHIPFCLAPIERRDKRLAAEREAAKETLRQEIAAAKNEAHETPLYRAWPARP